MSVQHVCFCCCGNSSLHFLAASVRSVFETHSNPVRLRLYILFEFLAEADLEKLKKSWEPWVEQISYHRMSDYLGELALTKDYGYWYRVWAYKVLPREVEKLIYLDYDVVVLKDITPLWNLDLGDHLGAAAEDPLSREHAKALSQRAESLGLEYSHGNRYFNSGVLVLNLRRWRELDVANLLESQFRGHRPHQQFHDQAELNMLFSEDFLGLSAAWNVIEVSTYDLTRVPDLEPDQLNPKILHFAGREKVTARWRRQFEKDAFYSVLDKTYWRGWRSPNDQTLMGRFFSEILEFYYLRHHGPKVPSQKVRLRRLLMGRPYLPLVSLLVPLNRLANRVLRSRPVRKIKAKLGSIRREAYMRLCFQFPQAVKLYHRLFRAPLKSEFERSVDSYSRTRDSFTFLQVGANDGFSRDPIHKFVMRFGWSGVLVEPQPEVFRKELKRIYGSLDNLHLLEAAVDKRDGFREFFRLSCSNLRWAHGLSSFKRENLEKLINNGYVRNTGFSQGLRLQDNLHDCIVTDVVPTVTFESLLEKYSIRKLDLLQIDCEGYDAELLRMFPFHKLRPHFVRFESQHLSATQMRDLEAMMKDLGYSWIRERFDTFCELLEPDL